MPAIEPVQVACTLEPKALGARLVEIRRLTREHLRSHDLAGRTLRLTYDGAAASELSRIIELERGCCAFLDFQLDAAGDRLELTITAPAQEGMDARWLFAQFLPEEAAATDSHAETHECSCCGG